LMQLVGVRSTNPDDGLVAVLVEDGGPAMLAIPVTPHEGLVLHAHGPHRSPSWPRLLDDVVEALGGRIGRTELDVDDDARIVARLVVEVPAYPDRVTTVPCTPGEGLLLSGYHRFPVHARSAPRPPGGGGLRGYRGAERLAQWRRMLSETDDLTDDTRD